MSLRSRLKKWDQQHSDSAGAVRQLIGMLFAPALLFRTGIHVWTAVIADSIARTAVSARLLETDVTPASPVRGVRDRRLGRVARFLTAVTGLAAWTGIAWATIGHPLVRLWLRANVLLLLADPVAGVAWYAYVTRIDPQSPNQQQSTE